MIKALRVGSGADIRDAERFHTDFHLLDAAAGKAYGGTGRTWDWALAAQRRSRVPVILAGGLTPENVAEAIAAVRPWGVDVASGVESAPGHQGPGEGRGVHRGRVRACPRERRSSIASAPTAASTSPRR